MNPTTDFPDTIRFYDLTGALNFRDIGGYENEEGRRVRYGQVFRSGHMSGLRDDAAGKIAELGIRSVCDLRAPDEREAHPSHWLTGRDIQQSLRDDTDGVGDVLKFYRAIEATPQIAQDVMFEGYRNMPYALAPSYRALFARLLAGGTPLIVHCAGGKDRTGIAAALILSALGVPRATILRDYQATDRVFDRLFAVMGAQVGSAIDLERNREVWRPLLVCHPAYLEASFDAFEKNDGGVYGYLATHANVDAADIRLLRERYTE